MKKKPNILWLMTDEQRRDSLGAYGSPWAATPNLDRLAAQGVVFEHAVTPAPVCGPARASLLSGQYPNKLDVWYNLTKDQPQIHHLTSKFEEAGYQTASFGKQHYCSSNAAFQHEEQLVLSEQVHPFGYAAGYDQKDFGVIQYPPNPYPWIFGGRFPEGPELTSEAQVVQRAIRWLEAADEEQPFLLRLSFNGPHTPVAPPAPFDTQIPAASIHLPEVCEALPEGAPQWIRETLAAMARSDCLSAEDIRAMRSYYYGQVAFLDQQFGLILEYLEKRGLLEDTIVAYVSDHGAHLGDYGLVQKQTFYEPVIKVPFFFSYPREFAAAHIQTPVETRSLLPSLLDVIGIDPADGHRSLKETLKTGREPRPQPVFSEFTLGSFEVRHDDRLVMVQDGDWKLTLCLEERQDGELYNLASDPFERNNLFRVPSEKSVVQRLTKAIEDHVQTI